MTKKGPLVKKSECFTKMYVLAIFFCKSKGNGTFYNGKNSEILKIEFLTRKIHKFWYKTFQKKHNCQIWGACFLTFNDFVNNIGGKLRFKNF